ncbi:hypothetical protein Tco_0677784 [Tanacetum coccineum]|uniref:Uncharacterized protein n=1 Tax=Tanacetum coccineum TaxID=301880 RepID=A0ABQ4XEB4_9ASTR
MVPSITIAQLGVGNQDYPSKDINMEPTTPTLDDLALSLFRVYIGSSKIGSGPGRTEKALADFEDQFETLSRLLAPLPEDLKQLLCGFLIFDDHVYTLKRDNARSSSVGVMGSMLTSFDGYSWLLTPSCAIVIDGTMSFLSLLNIGKLECIFRYTSRPFAKRSL